MSDTYGSGLSFGAPESTGGPAFGPDAGPGAPLDISPQGPGGPGPGPQAPDAPAEAGPQNPFSGFGSSLRNMVPGARYTPPDPQTAPLDQAADLLQQRVKRASGIATNPLAQIFAPEQVQAARDFVPKAAEQLQKIEQQRSAIQSGRVQAQTLGLAPGEVSDQATQEDRLTVATSKALKGNMAAFQGIQAVDPTRAAAIAPQVYETVARHLGNAQTAFDSLAAMQNEGQYQAKIKQLRDNGTLMDLEALGMKLPPTLEAFGAAKASEGRALREARIGINTIGQKLEDRNTYQPMEKKEAETYAGRLTTPYGDHITNGQWGRNGASGSRGVVVNGLAVPEDLGRGGVLGNAEQRKEIGEQFRQAVPVAELEKQRSFNRTYTLAEPTAEQKKRGDVINDNPNVQQGIAEGLASMLRGGSGGANIGLLKIEVGKRGVIQGLLDKAVTEYGGAVNTLSGKQLRPYLTHMTGVQQREVLDALKQWNDSSLDDRAKDVARRAGALGFDVGALGLGKHETTGAIADAVEEGRQAQIARMRANFQAIGGGDGVIQLGAQRPGAGATELPPGAQRSNELPGAAPLQTPVQQSQQPQPSGPGAGGGEPPAPTGAPPQQPAPASQPGPATPQPQPSPGATDSGAQQPAPPAPNNPAPQPGGAGQPVTIAGQKVSAPPEYASFLTKTQNIEAPQSRYKNPWIVGNDKSSAKGAFQHIEATWKENKPADAPDDPRKATPQQQVDAQVNLTRKIDSALTANDLPVTDTSRYIAHNLGVGGGSKLMAADLSADAREVVGERAARNNPKFFRGRPTVATVLQRYAAEMQDDGTGAPDVRTASLNTGVANDGSEPPTRTPAERATARMQRSVRGRESAPADTSTERRPGQWGEARDAAIEHAPAIGSTVGATAGFFSPVPGGTAIGGGLGGGAGQSFKDYMQGREQSPGRILKETALGAVLGIVPEGRPIVGALARAGGAGSVEAVSKAAEPDSNAADITEAGMKGAGLAAGGEAFGRALGMVGHKVYSLFAPNAQAAVRTAAKTYSDATKVLETEAPKLPGANGAAGGPNPKYQAAETAKTKAEQTLKDAGLNPEEAAYAHKVSSESPTVPKQEAQLSRPGELEKQRVGEGYQQIENEVGGKGVGNVKPTPKLADGPMAAVANGQVLAKHADLARSVEMEITQPAKSWQEKWQQLQKARSGLLTDERDALSSTAAGKTREAADMRRLADAVRTQQAKAAEYVFGKAEGARVMQRLEVLDTRYRRLMEATNGMDLAKAAKLTGPEGREADKRFQAFAAGDPAALAAWNAIRKAGPDVEKDVKNLVAFERIPVLGKVYSAVKLLGSLNEWVAKRAANDPVKFTDLLNMPSSAGSGKTVRDILGGAGARAAVSAGQ